MAALTRSKTVDQTPQNLLSRQIPTPFSREQLLQLSESSVTQETSTAIDEQVEKIEAGPCTAIEQIHEDVDVAPLKDVMPSIIHVQKSCLMTLNNLLTGPNWHPILPDRRHSMPTSSRNTSFQTEPSSTTSALQTLVTNLRAFGGSDEMLEMRQNSESQADLLSELHSHVENLSTTLSESDFSLAKAIVSLLSNLSRLSDIQTNISQIPTTMVNQETSSTMDVPSPDDVFDTLTRQLSDLQLERLSSQARLLAPSSPPRVAVEVALLWSRIDFELDNVVAMCRRRTETLPRFSQDSNLPPQYEIDDYDLDTPPDYDHGARISFDDTKSIMATSRQVDEKMRLDLEAVTMAIDRLYLVAPQLHSQRVELKSSKLAQMEKARQEGVEVSLKSDIRDLENLLDLIGKASERTLKDQSVVLEDGWQSRLEKARKRESLKRDAFVEQLVRHSNAGRIHGQDAVLQSKIRNPEALLSLPEFIREPVPVSERQKDADALLTLPEFVKEAVPPHILQSESEPEQSELPAETRSKRERHRSLSAPPLSWLMSSSSRLSYGSSSSISGKGKGKLSQRRGFDIVYVAENHENLHHTLVFFSISGPKTDGDVHAEIIPPVLEDASEGGGDHLVIKSGANSSLPLMLPAITTPGEKEVRAQSGHYEIKLLTQLSSTPSEQLEPNSSTSLLDAAQLKTINPTTFLCASCSLPLIQSTKIQTYKDLPSEHWHELVEAWMCHADQKLHDQVAKHSKDGFWPSVGQALVGGSYILFEESAMNMNNLLLAQEAKHDDNWRLARCLCGAIIGRCQEKELGYGSRSVYRVLKYSVRPVSLTSDPLKIPLSAFIVEDMNEFVQAHASYRFVIQDEEEERARILIWLFKPRIRLAYTISASHGIPKSANITAAKVLYKILKPPEGFTDIKTILNKYPGFPQAEYLSYPMSICRRVAGLLMESNSAYPETLRMMTGLHVGWLQRV